MVECELLSRDLELLREERVPGLLRLCRILLSALCLSAALAGGAPAEEASIQDRELLFAEGFETGTLFGWDRGLVSAGSSAPFIIILRPAESVIPGYLEVQVVVEYEAAGGAVDPADVVLLFDGAPIPFCSVSPRGAVCLLSSLKPGSHELSVRVSDPLGSFATATHPFEYVEDVSPPLLEFLSPAGGSLAGVEEVAVQLSHRDLGSGLDPETLSLTLDGQSLLEGCVQLAFETLCPPVAVAAGPHVLVASAADYRGQVAKETLQLSIVPDTDPPAVAILVPAGASAIR